MAWPARGGSVEGLTTMNMRIWKTFVLGLSTIALMTAHAKAGDQDKPVSWKKTVIEGKFRSEGVAIADVNKDGVLDLLIGDSWYEAPSWTKHDIRKPGDFGDGLHSYSNCMTCWTDDINGDGWADELVIGFPGSPAFWYENPQGKPGYWTQHVIWHSACNETPLYTDLFGDGHRVLVMGWQPKGKNNEGQMAWFAPGKDPAQSWEMHPISEPGHSGKAIPGTFQYSHGLGVGDLNGDGLQDVICTGGWWERPKSGRNASELWSFHPARLGDAVADMIAYDLNHDGKADVIGSSAHQYGIWSFEQGDVKDGSPVFTKHDLFPDLVSETHALIAADINGDGLKDLVTGKRFWSHGKNEVGSDKPARLYWFEASRGPDGKITFTPREIDDQSGIGTQFVVADYNGDGRLDIVTANKKGVFLFEQVGSAK
jgi:FG-GAP-like repeat